MSYLFLIFFSLTSFANLQSLKVHNADLNYLRPSGTGTVEEIRLSLKLMTEPMPLEIHRTETSLQILAPQVGLEWENPIPLLHNMDKLWLEKGKVNVGKKNHTASALKLKFVPDQSDEYNLQSMDAVCNGESMASKLEDRLIEDCLNDLTVKVEKMEIPLKSTLIQILEQLPQIPDEDMPLSALDLKVKQGDFDLSLRLKLILRAGVYALGHVQFEDNKDTIAIRLDRVKYGYLPVTGIVFNQLRQRIKDPNIKIEQPWIRINLKKAP